MLIQRQIYPIDSRQISLLIIPLLSNNFLENHYFPLICFLAIINISLPLKLTPIISIFQKTP